MKNNKLKKFDNNLYKKYKHILGLDEVGRGCVAGPLVVAGVILKKNFYLDTINDSKKIKSIEKRKELKEIILKNCVDYKIIIYPPEDVDKYNPKYLSKLGMQTIYLELKNKFDLCLTDFEKIEIDDGVDKQNLVKGDATSFSIACASIVAKSTRDEQINKMNQLYPMFELLNNQGYLTKRHTELLKKFAPIKGLHRFSYKPVKEFDFIHKHKTL